MQTRKSQDRKQLTGNGLSATGSRLHRVRSRKNGLRMDVKINRVSDNQIAITLIGEGHEFDEVFEPNFASQLAEEFLKAIQIVEDAPNNS